MKATTIKVDGDLLRELERTKPPSQRQQPRRWRGSATRSQSTSATEASGRFRLAEARCRDRRSGAAPPDELPERTERILTDVAIRSNDHQAVRDRLADQHAVERVSMERGEPGEVKRRLLVEREAVDAVSVALGGNEAVDRLGQRKPPQRVLDGDLPGGDSAQEHFVPRIDDRLAGASAQRVGVCYQPEERDRIEQEPHLPLPSKASSRSRGSGLKNAGGPRRLAVGSPT